MVPAAARPFSASCDDDRERTMGVTIMVLEKEQLADTVVTNGEGDLNQNDDEGRGHQDCEMGCPGQQFDDTALADRAASARGSIQGRSSNEMKLRWIKRQVSGQITSTRRWASSARPRASASSAPW